MSFDYNGFSEHEVAPRLDDHVGEVYVLVFKNGTVEVPFYVGQTRRFLGRMDDYFWADFQAATDFKVGMAIKYFYSQPNGRVVARHKLVHNPHAEEKVILAEFKSSQTPLLNGVAYDYRTAVLREVLDQVHIRCREILSHAGIDTVAS